MTAGERKGFGIKHTLVPSTPIHGKEDGSRKMTLWHSVNTSVCAKRLNLVQCELTFLVGSFFCTTFAPNFKNTMKDKPQNIAQLIIAAIVVLGGMVLLHVGIQIDPKGEIHETVLVAFGEAATFAGSILGIDYHYKSRNHDNNNTNPQ